MLSLLAVALIASASAYNSNVNVVANVDYLNTLAGAVLPTVESLINDLKLGNYTFDVKYSFLSANIEVRTASKLCSLWRITWCSASVKTRKGFEHGEPSFIVCHANENVGKR